MGKASDCFVARNKWHLRPILIAFHILYTLLWGRIATLRLLKTFLLPWWSCTSSPPAALQHLAWKMSDESVLAFVSVTFIPRVSPSEKPMTTSLSEIWCVLNWALSLPSALQRFPFLPALLLAHTYSCSAHPHRDSNVKCGLVKWQTFCKPQMQISRRSPVT